MPYLSASPCCQHSSTEEEAVRLKGLQLMGEKREVTAEKLSIFKSNLQRLTTGYVPGDASTHLASYLHDEFGTSAVPREQAQVPQGMRLNTEFISSWLPGHASEKGVKAEEDLSLGSEDSQDPWLGACHDNHSIEHLPAALQRDSCLETQ